MFKSYQELADQAFEFYSDAYAKLHDWLSQEDNLWFLFGSIVALATIPLIIYHIVYERIIEGMGVFCY